jgi:hypothetical protein
MLMNCCRICFKCASCASMLSVKMIGTAYEHCVVVIICARAKSIPDQLRWVGRWHATCVAWRCGDTDARAVRWRAEWDGSACVG